MGLFGQSVVREFEERDPNYFFQVLLTRPKESKIQFNATRMWETEKEALNDLPYIIPKLVQRDPKEQDSLIIKDASILTKYIYVVRLEKPNTFNAVQAKVDDVEHDTLQRYLVKNNIMFKVKLKNNLSSASRNRVVNIAMLDIKESLKNTEFTKKCIKYTVKTDSEYDRFIAGLIESLQIASYDAYLGIPNPRRSMDLLDKFYSELHNAVNAANNDILRMGYKLDLFGEWDRGLIVLESLSSSFGESTIIYEEPSTLKIGGKPVDDEGEEDDNTDYNIPNEEEDQPAEETPAEEPAEEQPAEGEEGDDAPEGEEPAEETPDEEPEEDEAEDAPPTDYRIPDNADEEEPAEEPTEEQPAEGEEGGDAPEEGVEEPAEGEEDQGEDDAPTDYRIPANAGEEDAPEGEGEEQPAEGEEGGDAPEGEEPADGEEQDGEESKSKEEEIFADMNPEQKRIQDEELKDNYIKLYNTIGELIGRLNQVSTDNTSREPISFVLNQLTDMKQFVFKYLSEVYSTKTYIENNINYQQYLAILSNINNLLVKLNTKSTDID